MTFPGEVSSQRAWLAVALLAVVGCLNYLDRVMLTTMRISMVEAIPMSDAQFGLLTSVFLWTYALMSPLGGYLADRLSRTRVIIGSLFAWSVTTWLTAHATSLQELLATRALMGVSEACYMPAALALITDYHRGATRSLATGIHTIGVSIGSGLGGLGGWLAERHDWTFAFRFFGGIGVAYSLVLILALRDAPRLRNAAEGGPQIGFGAAVAYLFHLPAYWIVLVYWGLLAVASWAVVGWLPTFLGERFDLTQGYAGLSATAYMPPAIWAGALIGGRWSDRWSQTTPRGRLFVPMIGLAFAAPCIFVGLASGSLPVVVGAFMLFSLGLTFATINIMPTLCLIADERYRATGFGIINLVSSAVGGLSIYTGGFVRDAHVGIGVLFGCGAALMLACAALLWFIRPGEHVATRPDSPAASA